MAIIHQCLSRILIVGVGSIGERHVRCFLKTGRAEVSICETNRLLSRQVAARYEVERQFDDVNQALTEKFDAAVIAVPAHLHIDIAQQAFDAGLSLLIEKPLGVNLHNVSRLSASLSNTTRVVAIAYVLRCHPSLAEMRSAIQSGEYGNPIQIYVTAGQHFPTYRPDFSKTYYSNRATGGGAIQDAVTHLVNAAEWLVGPIDQVISDAAHAYLPEVEVEDVVHFLARHGSVLGSYSLNQFQAPNEITISVVCQRATLRYEGHEQRWRSMIEPGGKWQDRFADVLERDTLFVRQAQSFLDAIEGLAPPLCSFNDGLQSLRVNLALLSSLKSRCWEQIAWQQMDSD
jgi:predicted dehydrogenase